MARVATRRTTESWREAVARHARARDLAEPCLLAFDALVAEGRGEAEAAFNALKRFDLLSVVDLPGDPGESLAAAEEDAIEPPKA